MSDYTDMELTVKIAGVTVTQQRVAFLLPPSSVELGSTTLTSLLRQGVLKIVPSLGLRNPEELKARLKAVAEEREVEGE